MRVIAGEARGRRLVAPEGREVRPTGDRVREAIFNALTSLDAVTGAAVLDLFAGSGALGIEALSRGAARATFVERDRRARRVIETNLAATGLADRATVIGRSAESFLAELPGPAGSRDEPSGGDEPEHEPGDEPGGDLAGERSGTTRPRFGVALLDPPYAYDRWDDLLEQVPAALAVIETDRPFELSAGWELVRDKWYGSTLVVIARATVAPPAGPADGASVV